MANNKNLLFAISGIFDPLVADYNLMVLSQRII